MIKETLPCPGCGNRHTRSASKCSELPKIICPCGNYFVSKKYICSNGHKVKHKVSYFDPPESATCNCGESGSIYLGKVNLTVSYKGTGWASTAGKERFKVSWDEVEKITKESDRQAKENEGKKRKAVKEHLLDTL